MLELRKSILLAFAVAFVAAAGWPTSMAASDPMLGFDEASAAKQRELEQQFDAQLDASNLRSWMKRLAARPHHVGSPHGKANAEFMAELFSSWGYETRIEEFQVLFPTPQVRVVEMVAPTRFTAMLAETPIAGDATTGQTSEQLPAYNAYSIDGDVTGELVYVNYGIPDDYEELERRGISVEGRIVLARYGASWRGIKPKVAAEHGAIGCILYTDPRDDGYFTGDVYPKGGWRPEQGAQRGSVADMPLYPGDPLTPFRGATRDAERLPLDEVPTLTKIPVLPISYRDALPLLRELGGPVAPPAWRGALPATYHIGPGPAKVHLELKFDWSLAPAYDVIARLEGAEHPDQWILRGNHHDAWVNGATDPVSGMVALLEEARAVAGMRERGWKPKRTIVYAAWDAEEPGLLGSTEWVEHHADALREKVVVYINSDSNSRGFLRAGGSHTLERFVNQVARDVTDPQTGVSVGERARARAALNGSPEDRKQALDGKDLPLSPLGSGSDYTPFLQHLAIASLNLSFGGEGQYGQYHSIYDSFDHYTRFMDPEFEYGVALARVNGRAVMRLAGADVLPFEFSAPTAKIETYVKELTELADKMREETERKNALIEKSYHRLAADPKDPFVAPQPEEPVPHLNFAPLQNALAALKSSAEAHVRAVGARAAAETPLAAEVRAELNEILYRSERALAREEGLPGRPWFVHHIYAPGFYTGYGVKTIPGVREAIELRRWKEAEEQIVVAAEVLRAFAEQIDRAAALHRDE